jgi:hypothetical protein
MKTNVIDPDMVLRKAAEFVSTAGAGTRNVANSCCWQ